MNDDLKLIADAREHGYEFPSVKCSECGEPTYFVPGDMPQDSGHYVYHNHDDETPHVGHFSRLGGTWWCDTCNSPYCDLA